MMVIGHFWFGHGRGLHLLNLVDTDRILDKGFLVSLSFCA